MRMTSTELESYREHLVNLGRRLGGDFAYIRGEAFRQIGAEASGNLSSMPLHMADLGSDYVERDVALSLLETEGQLLEQIKTALGRIEQGTFGRCEECQRPIPVDRLQAVPYTPH